MTMTFDPSSATALLRQLTREVWVVTSCSRHTPCAVPASNSSHTPSAIAGPTRGGLTATWVTPASVDPRRPLLLAGIAPNHFTAELIDQSGALAAHLLAENQQELAIRMATTSGRDTDKLAGLDCMTSVTGSPILADCLAWFDCRVVARLSTGDRNYYWAEVVACGQRRTGPPLTDQAFFAAATAAQREQLLAQLAADVAVQAPRHAEWLAHLPPELMPADRQG